MQLIKDTFKFVWRGKITMEYLFSHGFIVEKITL